MVIRVKVGGKFKFSNLPKDIQNKLKESLANNCDVYAKGFEGILPGIKIDGKQVTKDNIHEFEKKSMPKEKAVPKRQSMKDNMTVKELKAEARKLKIKGAWKMKEDELVKALLKAGYQ